MYLNPDYTLQTLSGTPYLLPFGAGIASFRHQMRLDGTGAFLWDVLKKMDKQNLSGRQEELDMQELSDNLAESGMQEFSGNLAELDMQELSDRLAELVCKEYELPVSELPEIKKDIRAFLDILQKQDILTEETPLSRNHPDILTVETPVSHNHPDTLAEKEPSLIISIADMILELHGETALFSKELFSFKIPKSPKKDILPKPEHLHFYFIPEDAPQPMKKGTLLIDHFDMQLFSFEDGYLFKQPSSEKINCILFPKDGSAAYFYLTGEMDDTMRYDVFHAIRLVFSYAAMLRGYYLIHSASICYRDRAWLFSACSGTGKSTHAALWTKLWQNEIRNLNGDVNLLSIKNGIPTVHGIPWNGTSGIYDTGSLPLGGIIFLRRAGTDFIKELSNDQKILSFLQRLISPNWTEPLLKKQICFAENLFPEIFMAELHCTPQPSAAETIRDEIDKWLSNCHP